MAYIEQGLTGAYRQTWRKGNPRSLLQTIIEKNPKADEKTIRKLFWDEIEGDKELVRSCVEYWMDHNYRSLILGQTHAPSRHATDQAKQGVTRTLKQRIEYETRVALLELIMPNGKPLGDCTGPECASIGGWFAMLAKKIPPAKTVKQALTEDQVQAIWQRSKK